MISLNSIYEEQKKLKEDAVVGATGAAGGGEVVANADAADGDIAPNKGISADDVLGKCDHQRDGYLGTKCFHVPKKCGKTYNRLSTDGSKRKKKKTPYEKNMSILTDAELSRDLILAMHKVRERDIRKYIITEFGIDGNPLTDATHVEAVAYHPPSKMFFIKVVDSGKDPVKNWFCVADFDEKTLKFSAPVNSEYYYNDIMDAKQAQEEFKKILKMNGNSPNNVGSDDMNLWVIWGGTM